MNFQIVWLALLWKQFLVNAQQKRNIIVNGITPERHRYPYVASLQYRRRHICGATLIAPDVILTAAHCVMQPELINDLRVIVGEYHLQDHMDSGETFYITSVDIHPQFKVTNTYVDNDVMVMKISGFSTHKPVILNNKHRIPQKDNKLTVIGWGSVDTKGEFLSNVVQEVDLNYLFKWECLKEGVHTVTKNMLCAFDKDLDNIKEDSCYGDSGGPLIIKKDNEIDLQVGIVSYGTEICAEHPGIYTRLSRVYDWVRQRTCILSDTPPDYFDCEMFSNHTTFNNVKANSTVPSISPTDASSSLLPTRVQLVSKTELIIQMDDDNNDAIPATLNTPVDEGITSNTASNSHAQAKRNNTILIVLLALLFIIL
jgi:secreted trypsin-like serine protease